MGKIVDEEKAKNSPCICLVDEEIGAELCYSKGSIGALNEEQKKEYCNPKLEIPMTEEQKKVLKHFLEKVKLCSGKERKEFLACMREE